jgi:hypothetical protein
MTTGPTEKLRLYAIGGPTMKSLVFIYDEYHCHIRLVFVDFNKRIIGYGRPTNHKRKIIRIKRSFLDVHFGIIDLDIFCILLF